MISQAQATDALAALRDIHLPEPVPFWPLASGWWFDTEDRHGTLHVKLGRLDTSEAHTVAVELDPALARVPRAEASKRPADDGSIPADDLLVVNGDGLADRLLATRLDRLDDSVHDRAARALTARVALLDDRRREPPSI